MQTFASETRCSIFPNAVKELSSSTMSWCLETTDARKKWTTGRATNILLAVHEKVLCRRNCCSRAGENTSFMLLRPPQSEFLVRQSAFANVLNSLMPTFGYKPFNRTSNKVISFCAMPLDTKLCMASNVKI